MAKVLTFINEKGGIGKTRCCFNIAWELSKKKKILMIDMDGQRANLTYFCGIEKQDDTLTMYDVLKKGKSAEEAVINVRGKLDLIPATVDVSDISQTAKVKRMKEVIGSVRDSYDYIFIDVSPSPDWRQYISLAASDYALIIMMPDMASIEAVNGIMESIDQVNEVSNPALRVLGIVFNKNENRSNMSKEVKKITEQFVLKIDTKVFKNSIRNAVSMGEVAYLHKGITDYDNKSAAAEDVRLLAKEIEREVRKNG